MFRDRHLVQPADSLEIWKEGLAWKTTINRPNGQEEYQLILQPLWMLEGGVVALEIVVACPGQPEVNILGKTENGVEYPFVITEGFWLMTLL